MAGVMRFFSSWPNCPFSPAWGLSPATAMRGARPRRRCRKAWSSFPVRMISSVRSKCGTSRRGRCAVARTTVSGPPVRHMAKFSTPARVAKNSVCPGKGKPRAWREALWTGPVTTPWMVPSCRSRAASSRASHAACAEEGVGCPGGCPSARPMRRKSTPPGSPGSARQRVMSSGPIPAGSPMVIPRTGRAGTLSRF